MNVLTEKLDSIREAHRAHKTASLKIRRRNRRAAFKRAHAHYYRFSKGHHPCEALGTATKNTQRNKWNIRPSKTRRPEGRFAKLRATKMQFGL